MNKVLATIKRYDMFSVHILQLTRYVTAPTAKRRNLGRFYEKKTLAMIIVLYSIRKHVVCKLLVIIKKTEAPITDTISVQFQDGFHPLLSFDLYTRLCDVQTLSLARVPILTFLWLLSCICRVYNTLTS